MLGRTVDVAVLCSYMGPTLSSALTSTIAIVAFRMRGRESASFERIVCGIFTRPNVCRMHGTKYDRSVVNVNITGGF